MRLYLALFVLPIFLFTLNACGGGSSSDDTPNAITLVEITGAALNKSIESDSVTISGIDTAVGVSITGGEYAINNGSFTSAAGTISNGQSLKVRLTSANALNQSTSLTITVSDVSAVFTVTTRSVDAAGLYEGTGTVNSGTALSDVTGMIYNDRLMIFSEAQNVLYDGEISNIVNGDITASITVYKDGVNNQSAEATGNISGTTLSFTLSGTDFGSGTLSLTADITEFEKDATFARFNIASGIDSWFGATNTVNQQDDDLGIQGDFGDSNAMSGSTGAPSTCQYTNGTKTIPNNTVNIYVVNYDVAVGSSCNHTGDNYTGIATIVDNTGTDDQMWFAASNGTNSNFSIMRFVDN